MRALSERDVGVLLRGEPQALEAWSERWDASRLALHVGIILIGAGSYGAAMGWWRDPQQALYTAIKFPLIILLTTFGNALLNAMLAPLLGLNVPFRQSFLSILMSFTIASAIFGSFGPLAAFLVWNASSLSAGARISGTTYSVILVSHVAVIAFAGAAANVRLLQLLEKLAGKRWVARRVLWAWLAGNLFLGSQLSWICRPFFGSPGLPVQFLRDHPFQGNFYESVFRSLLYLLHPH